METQKFKHLAVNYPLTQFVSQDHHSGVLKLGALLQLLSYSHSPPLTEDTSRGQSTSLTEQLPGAMLAIFVAR